MMDRFSSYSIHSQGLKKLNGIGLLGKVNSGLFFLREGTYDLDFIERCLSNEGFRSGKVWLIEQTTWAAVASRLNGTLYNPQQVAVVASEKTVTDDLIAGHFVTSVRHLVEKFSPQAEVNDVGQPQFVTSIPPHECTFFDLAYTELRTRLRRTNRKISEKFMALMPLSK
ncbi:hypothetical protein HC928_15960 [bacterium]|nr:hypothetical protein [bacterium]